MKNKKLTYLLLVLVLFIWGLVFYRIFSKEGDGKSARVKGDRSFTVTEQTKSDSFAIKNDYPDPFKSANTASHEYRSVNYLHEGSGYTTTGNNSQQNIVWPEVVYKGIIVNGKTKQTTVIISVDGVSYLTPVGKSAGVVEIVSVVTDSVQLKFNKSVRYFKKQK